MYYVYIYIYVLYILYIYVCMYVRTYVRMYVCMCIHAAQYPGNEQLYSSLWNEVRKSPMHQLSFWGQLIKIVNQKTDPVPHLIISSIFCSCASATLGEPSPNDPNFELGARYPMYC